MATGEAPSIAVANFRRFLAPDMVPSTMSNLAVGLWSGLNDLCDGLGEAFFLRSFGCFSICGPYMPGMCLWKWRSVSWSGNFDRLSDLSSSTNKFLKSFFQISRMCGVAV